MNRPNPSHLTTSVVGLVLLALMVLPTWSAGAGEGSDRRPASPAKSPHDACALLDDALLRSRMDGLLFKLAVTCGREELLGTVRQEPDLEVGAGESRAPDVPVNNPTGDTGATSHTQSETSIAVSGTTGTVCSGYNDSWHYFSSGQGFAGFSRSTDGGATFTDQGALGTNSYGDPAVVWRKADGSFYYAALHSSGLGIWRSTDDCQTFAFLAMIHSAGSDDKELLAVDNNIGSPSYGRLYVPWTDFGAGGYIRNTYSADGGATWSPAVTLSTTTDVQGAWPVVAPNGDVYVSWVRWNPWPDGPIDIEVARSTDGGVSFTQVANPATAKGNPRASSATSNCGRPALNGNIRYLPSPQIAVGPDGALHVVYSYDPDGYNTGDVVDVFYRKSTDSGASWGPEVRVNDDTTTSDQYFPALSVGGSNVVSVTFYDRRNDAANLLQDYYQAFSYDGGTTWEPNQRLSDVSTPIYIDPNLAGCYHGDYDTHLQTATAALAQWSDDRNQQGGHNDPDVFLEGVPVSTDFLVTASPASLDLCSPNDATYTVDVLQFQGFTEPVTLTASGNPAGTAVGFSSNPVTPPGTSVMTVSGTGGAAAGSSFLTVTGTSSPSGFVHDTQVTLNLFTIVPAAPGLLAPANGATGVDLLPVLDWDDPTQATSFNLEIATDSGFTNVVYTATANASTHRVGTSLSPLTDYFWHVAAVNVCGTGSWSSPFAFTTRDIPPVLVVDDDDNGPDVRAYYTAALDAVGLPYDIWDTANSNTEPSGAQLSPYRMVVWFTGEEFGGSAGPGAEGSSGLGSWLDGGNRCLFISAQDYYYDWGLTPFMQTYLGVASMVSDVDYTTATGTGEFAGYGPYSLNYPISNYSDTVTPDATAALAFLTGAEGAAILKQSTYTTLFFGYPFEAIPTVADREAVMQRIVVLCGVCEGPDSDGDGVADVCDICPGFDDHLDADGDGVPDGCDICPGYDDHLDADSDGVPDGCDICLGDDATGDGDGDGVCADRDCDDGDNQAQFPDNCGVCGGDDSTCLIFRDGFETGDTSGWSVTVP